VLGVLGAPDPAQRDAIGRVARILCDRLVLTSGSFRANPSLGTLEGLINGARKVPGAELAIVPDRTEAIANAVRGALPGDVVAVLGRGNVVEAIHDRKVDDRGSLSAAIEGRRRQRLDPVGTGETSTL
jgi:UDP-N-acetylmuramoyl-L-alanyl-D-glutamate--2,6-diaminopimelate ligase